jgi:adenylate kinase
MTTRLLIVGPQGSGKGTQGVRVAEAFGVPVVSTGDIFRANIKGGTELGLKVKAITDAGNLVPDDVTGEIVSDRLSQDDASSAGFLLDGYPRNAAQVAYLDGFLAESGASLDAVILLDVPREESLARITERAKVEGRSDDTEEAIAKRLDIYESSTASTESARSTTSRPASSRLSTRAVSRAPDRIPSCSVVRSTRSPRSCEG